MRRARRRRRNGVAGIESAYGFFFADRVFEAGLLGSAFAFGATFSNAIVMAPEG
jgi:hypothetical protein